MSQLSLKPNPTLKDFQEYVAEIIRERGFAKESVQDNFIMLTEEVGELAKALRTYGGIKMANDSVATELNHEAADILWCLICVCNQLGVDLEQAFRDKEEKNKQRVWK